MKVFIVAGELSGDKLGGWYLKRRLKKEPSRKVLPLTVHAVGGDALEEAGATIYERFETLNVVGLVEIIKHLRRILRFLNKLANKIVSEGFDEVVVIDFPGFNLRLIKKLKQLNPKIKITYLSPPQLWAWGASRIKGIKKYCDDVIVLYPFEVAWYQERGVEARWLGTPAYERCAPYAKGSDDRDNAIAIMAGSRSVEIQRLLPLFLDVARRFLLAYPSINIVIPLAESIDKGVVERMLRKYNFSLWRDRIKIVQGEREKMEALSRCCLALTKPGTVTLELGLLGIPAVVAYKASWLTYVIAKLLVKIQSMALPNLLLKKIVYPELLQLDCKDKKIFVAMQEVYKKYLADDKKAYQLLCEEVGTLRDLLKS